MSIPEFIARCDAYQEAAEVSRVWLSKRLFNDTYRLDDLAQGESDIGVQRLERAMAELADLEAQRGKVDQSGDDRTQDAA